MKWLRPIMSGTPSAGDRDLEGFRQSILYFHKLFVFTQDSFQIEDQLVDGEKARIDEPYGPGNDEATPPAPPALPSPTEVRRKNAICVLLQDPPCGTMAVRTKQQVTYIR